MSVEGINAANNLADIQGVDQAKPIKKAEEPKVDLSDPVDTVELSGKAAKKEGASTAKKVGVGIASFLLPGLGQFINGEPKKGFAYLGGSIGCAILAGFTGPIGAVAALAVGVSSIVDAVKNAN